MFSETMEVVLKARMDDIRTEAERVHLIRLAQAGAPEAAPSRMSNTISRRMPELWSLVFRGWKMLTQPRKVSNTLSRQESTPTL